jgi:drug/metabolite transporter (DMT)-like permease
MAELLALIAACAFALGSVLQQKGTLEAPAGEDDPRFLVQILRRPIWLAGGACQVAGWILQAVALDSGSLIVVQSLCAMSLVMALPLGVRITHQNVDRRVWVGAASMVAGIVLFLSVGAPSSGNYNPPASAWWSAIVASLVIGGVLVVLGRRRRGAVRALTFGAAAGVGFAFQASVTKVFVGLVGGGVATLLHSWTTYALVASALLGFALQQSALRTGVLAAAMGSSNAVTLFGSVAFGIGVFDETLSGSGDRIAAAAGLVIALVGIALLSGAKPPSDGATGAVPPHAAGSGARSTPAG